ncbi:MAG: TIGR03915 family putative DNA repair protein [Planctomycetota bacterium]
MTYFFQPSDFDQFRLMARKAVLAGLRPNQTSWHSPDQGELLFKGAEISHLSHQKPNAELRVPQSFLTQVKTIWCHRDPSRLDVIYRILWRVHQGERHLLDCSSDDDVQSFKQMDQAVRRDVHKMKAFVRFRRVSALVEGGPDCFVAWHCPDHRIATLAAPFFARRFGDMHWSIMTPTESAHWDTESLRFGPGASRDDAPNADELEDLWRTYYRSIFNPARLKVKAMKAELPVRHWRTLPEATEIEDLIREAPSRVEEMFRKNR